MLKGPCTGSWRPIEAPFVEILDPNSSHPRFVLSTCGAQGVHMDIVGHTLRLPGTVEVTRLRFQNATTGEEWEATAVTLAVTEFGEPGAVVSGSFQGTMSARLNRDPVPVRGRFRVRRAPDRYAP